MNCADDIVDMDQLDGARGVGDRDRQIARDVVAERRHDRVVVGPAPLAEDARQPVDHRRRAGAGGVGLEGPLRRQPSTVRRALSLARPGSTRTARSAAAGADSPAASRPSSAVNRVSREPTLPVDELLFVLGTVDARQVEHHRGPGDGRCATSRRASRRRSQPPRSRRGAGPRTRFLPMNPFAPVTAVFIMLVRYSTIRSPASARCTTSSIEQQLAPSRRPTADACCGCCSRPSTDTSARPVSK